MKTKSRYVKRKSPDDFEFQCGPISVSMKQNLGPIDAFVGTTMINVDSLDSESPLTRHRLHEAPLSKGNFVTREHAYNRTAVYSDLVVTTHDSEHLSSEIDESIKQKDTCCYVASEIEESSKQKELCPHGSDQFSVNKGDARFAATNIQAPFATAPNPAHTHVVHGDSIASVMAFKHDKFSSKHTLGDTSSNVYCDKNRSSWYQQIRSRTHMQQPRVQRRCQWLLINQESPTIFNHSNAESARTFTREPAAHHRG
uniref:Uncharacterized protein n=1 Tax=Tanacetum cinerariifolium TaxID=118510 RepID=A0A6L2LMJ6_TANCI|nr:hypothetical protein [Tanacetum cinerariifolium]